MIPTGKTCQYNYSHDFFHSFIRLVCFVQIMLLFGFSQKISFIEGSHTKAFFEEFLQGNAISFDFKWLRGVHNGSFTGMQILFKISEISQNFYIFEPKNFF